MEDEQLDNKDFIISLTIDKTAYEDVEVNITEPSRSIREQINRMVDTFELPRLDQRDMPLQYLIAQESADDFGPEILEFEDENGREQSLLDFNIQPGDHLRLIAISCAYGCPIPDDFQQETNRKSLSQKLKHFFGKIFHF